MKITMTESGYGRNLGALLSLSPVRAARGGALGWLSEALREQTPFLADRIETAAASLIQVLGVETVLDVPSGLARLSGRPPAKVIAALRCPDVVEVRHRVSVGPGRAQGRDLS